MDTKHTPGTVTPLCDCGCWSENMAEARLIAAAPELLEALRKAADALEAVYQAEMERTGEWDMLPPDALEMAKAAIRKAEGE